MSPSSVSSATTMTSSNSSNARKRPWRQQSGMEDDHNSAGQHRSAYQSTPPSRTGSRHSGSAVSTDSCAAGERWQSWQAPPRHGHHGDDFSVDISVAQAASFFRTYFSVVHPQYPFLDMQLCSGYYLAWKQSLSGRRLIFALGSLIESKNDDAPYFRHQNLKALAQAEQSIMTDSNLTPLLRLQAMLLSAMFALHAENTWRIAHISGVIIKFATVHRFHRLRPATNADGQICIRVWSSIYALDRTVCAALGIPASLPDMYISSPLYEVDEVLSEAVSSTGSPVPSVPWLADYEGPDDAHTTAGDPDLRTFAHICRIRALQSSFMHAMDRVDRDDPGDGDLQDMEGLQAHLLTQLSAWEDPLVLARHSVPGSDGYRSPVWLAHIGHLARLSVCVVNRANVHGVLADTALQASCAACTTFRALQKKRAVAQPWLVVLSQFKAAVTLWYIVWGRSIPVSRQVSDAMRDCSAILAIFAERWPRAEPYRDCFELLSTSIPRSQPLGGRIGAEARQTLAGLCRQLEESGIHRLTSRMLREMAEMPWDPM
ncbi:hypothetical protein SEUCBS139899_010182 [Sporothrix eucalyptigena]